MSKTQRQRQAENIIEAQFPLPSQIDCSGLVDTNALMNAEKTLLSNDVLIKKVQERKLAEENCPRCQGDERNLMNCMF